MIQYEKIICTCYIKLNINLNLNGSNEQFKSLHNEKSMFANN